MSTTAIESCQLVGFTDESIELVELQLVPAFKDALLRKFEAITANNDLHNKEERPIWHGFSLSLQFLNKDQTPYDLTPHNCSESALTDATLSGYAPVTCISMDHTGRVLAHPHFVEDLERNIFTSRAGYGWKAGEAFNNFQQLKGSYPPLIFGPTNRSQAFGVNPQNAKSIQAKLLPDHP
ncbi:MAG: hypothetical protein KDJ75_06055 [Alphaproteobacteria bacterium]|nr:hypothetical protein [Alphaproteobacteria bacterium]